MKYRTYNKNNKQNRTNYLNIKINFLRSQIVISAFNMYGTTWNNFCPSECRGNITWLTGSKSFCNFVPIIETVHTTLTFLSELNYMTVSFKACDNSSASWGSTLVIFLFFFWEENLFIKNSARISLKWNKLILSFFERSKHWLHLSGWNWAKSLRSSKIFFYFLSILLELSSFTLISGNSFQFCQTTPILQEQIFR